MKSAILLTLIAGALTLLPAPAPAHLSRAVNGGGGDPAPSLVAREGYRVEVHRTPWALDGVSKDGKVVWIRTAESGCNRFDHVRVTEVRSGFRLVAFDVGYTPTSRKYGCAMYLLRPRNRVELPHPLAGDRLLGECVPRDPRETCALLNAVVGLRKGEPERDPWLVY